MAIHESGEDYLEAILLLQKKKDGVHAVDVAKRMGYAKPSVTRAMKILKQDGLIVIERNHIGLTPEGERRALEVYERHQTIARFLAKLGVEEKTASADACRMEHHISRETFEAIKRFLETERGNK